jgi:hypothetical protein
VVVLLFPHRPDRRSAEGLLGAVIVSAAVGLVEPAAWRGLCDADRVEFTIAAMTTAGVVAVGVLEAIIVAAGLSMVDVVRRSAQPHDAVLGWVQRLGRWADVAVHPSARLVPGGVAVYRLYDRLFVASRSRAASGHRRLSMASSASTAVVGSLTAGDDPRKANVGQHPDGEQRVLLEGALGADTGGRRGRAVEARLVAAVDHDEPAGFWQRLTGRTQTSIAASSCRARRMTGGASITCSTPERLGQMTSRPGT